TSPRTGSRKARRPGAAPAAAGRTLPPPKPRPGRLSLPHGARGTVGTTDGLLGRVAGGKAVPRELHCDQCGVSACVATERLLDPVVPAGSRWRAQRCEHQLAQAVDRLFELVESVDGFRRSRPLTDYEIGHFFLPGARRGRRGALQEGMFAPARDG